MDDAVFCTWKGMTYMKPYRKRTGPISENQEKVRKAFTSLVRDWKYLAGVIHDAWEKAVQGQPKMGFNEFMSRNVKKRRDGVPVELAVSGGEEIPINFAAAAGATAGTISVTFEAIPAEKHLTLFVRKKVALGEETPITRHDCGAAPASPVTIPSLEAATPYEVYAVVTDAAYTDAKTVSASVSGDVTTA